MTEKDVMRWLGRLGGLARNPHFWAIFFLLVLGAIAQYPEQIGLATLSLYGSPLILPHHTFERVLFLVPISYAGYIFGLAAGLVTTAIALTIMLPRVIFISPDSVDAVMQVGGVVIVGVLVNLWFRARAGEAQATAVRQQVLAAMTVAQEKLRAQIRNTMRHEKELTALSKLSSALAVSLEMGPLLRSAIAMVMEIMRVEVVLIYNLDEGARELTVVAYEGVPPEFAQSVDRMSVGEGFNGRVAETGEPLLIEDASRDPRLTREAVRREELQAQLIVPVKSRGKVLGTLCVAVRQPRVFAVEEIELLTAIASQVGVAIENTRLHQRQLMVAEQLSESESHYRTLFESAHDAIWVHDLEGNILSANKACEPLTGYSSEQLSRMNARDFLSPEGRQTAREVRRGLLEGQAVSQPYEQRLIRRDGSEAILMLTTNLVSRDGHPQAFQNIARDISEEKRMQENLRSYVQQITRAQEEERLRIARELHDSSAQNLIVLLHQLENFLRDQAELPIEKARELWGFHEQIRDTLQEIRRLSRDLRPSVLDDVGLLSALHLIVRELKTEYGLEASLKVQGVERRFPQEVELLLFRIVQEALRNAGKHSQASGVEVAISFEDSKITIIVRDNGRGFELPAKISDFSRGAKLGLVGMEERVRLLGGRLEIETEPGKGTSVIVEAPV